MKHDDELDAEGSRGAGGRFTEFDCPSCNANNPHDDGFAEGDEVRCYYCGVAYRVQRTGEGKLRLREV